jgi:lysyl-tRNA synthetase, class II
MEEQSSQVIKERRAKAESLRSEGIHLFPNTYRPRHEIAELRERFEDLSTELLDKVTDTFDVAGRIMAKRDFGKSVFFDLKDHSGKIQGFIQKNDVTPEEYGFLKKLDIGDLIGIGGQVFRTKKGELTIRVFHLELVTKSLLPLPEKFHDLNVELRYRQRYLDLIMNDSSRRVFQARAKVVSALRRFLLERSFMEVETPMMQVIPGGATARPFETYHQALDMKLYLRIAPELYLKRLLVGGFHRVFELNRNFRNEGISTQHNPEFTMLEFYRAYADFHDMMDLTEEMFIYVAEQVNGGRNPVYQGREIRLDRPWKRIAFHESLIEIGGAPPEIITDYHSAENYARTLGADIPEKDAHGKILAKIFDLVVEPNLVAPTFVTFYPTDISPLARRNEKDPNVTDRFELFIVGREMANGFSELNDPLDQLERFKAQVAEREAGDDEAQFMDEDYVRALMYGMPPAGGEGVGVDRLVMLLTDAPSIKDVILFPHQRPEK